MNGESFDLRSGVNSQNDARALAQTASGEAYAELRQALMRAGFVEADRHDLEQEMVLDLLRRLPRFDARLSKRETFITRIVEHRIATLIESQRAGGQ